jgi:response regulator RpfG family c-di-GMP phosphodiesterase
MVAARRHDVAIVDLVMPEMPGTDLAEYMHEASPDTQVVIFTGYGGFDAAVEAIRRGVFDFVDKGSLDLGRLEITVRQAAARALLARHNRELVAQVEERNRLLAALHEIGRSLGAEPNPDRILAETARHARELLGAQECRALLFAPLEGNVLVVEGGAGKDIEALRGARFTPGEGLAATLASTGDTIVQERASDHVRYSPRSDDLGASQAGFLGAAIRREGVIGALLVAGRERPFDAHAAETLTILGRQAAVALAGVRLHERAIMAFGHTCNLLGRLLERWTLRPGHGRRVAALADRISRRLGLDDAARRDIHFAAQLHDVGKLMLPARSGEPSKDEAAMAVLREHVSLGRELLEPLVLWEGVLAPLFSHHERWDGGGYPLGLVGEEIPLGGRIIAIADAFDALVRDRIPEQAVAEIRAFSGRQFEPRLVNLLAAEWTDYWQSEQANTPAGS